MNNLLNKIAQNLPLDRGDLKKILLLETKSDLIALFKAAYAVKLSNVGNKVYFRGIIELSNICDKNCFYCGIRKENQNVNRFMMSKEEILHAAQFAHKANYGSILLQSGERQDETFVAMVEDLIKSIKAESNNKLGITLSLGEQSFETYKRWHDAGAHRYLLRIETSNSELYKTLHPNNDLHRFDVRLNALTLLREAGYQVGTGVMMGLPNQTIDDLVNDIIFFKEHDIDMIGMGPYIVHDETPMGKSVTDFDPVKQVQIGLKMIAATRLYLRDINIAATTALQALDPIGREKGLRAGANIIMPNISDTKYRKNYQLYQNKPCLDENSSMCQDCLQDRIDTIDEVIGYNEWGDSPHFFKRNQENKED